MPTIADRERTLEDLHALLGPMPASRIRQPPTPGMATVEDVHRLSLEGVLCELVDGVLVEKTVGFDESGLAVEIAFWLIAFVKPRKLGRVYGPDGTVRLNAETVRIPDVAFYSNERLQSRHPARAPIPFLTPNLAVEVLSKGNTPEEMDRKRRDYFEAGVELVWYFDPRTRTVDVWAGLDDKVTLDATDTLDGCTVLPGFTLSLVELFATLDE